MATDEKTPLSEPEGSGKAIEPEVTDGGPRDQDDSEEENPPEQQAYQFPKIPKAERQALDAEVLERDRGKPIDLATIRGLSLIQCTHAEAAAFLRINEKTFRKWLQHPEVKAAWDDGRGAGRVSLRRKQWRVATLNGHPQQARMLIHLGKAWLGQAERVEVDTPPQSPEKWVDRALLKDLSEDELQLLLRIHERLRSGDSPAALPVAAGGTGPPQD